MKVVDHVGKEITIGGTVWLRSAFYTEENCELLWGESSPRFEVIAVYPHQTAGYLVELYHPQKTSLHLVYAHEVYVTVRMT